MPSNEEFTGQDRWQHEIAKAMADDPRIHPSIDSDFWPADAETTTHPTEPIFESYAGAVASGEATEVDTVEIFPEEPTRWELFIDLVCALPLGHRPKHWPRKDKPSRPSGRAT